jgi:alkanesulfonate monooxygenase SsuD/methylene tetrahydromethanopterin reductase-like flavin-dependent oxidoreductase (luciferase family)
MFADGSKVHAVNHEGKYFRCRGPLNAPRSPQGRPPICQAGGSSRGQDFAARWADTIITDAGSVEAMKDYREGVRRRARAAGRDPNSIKVLFLAYPLVDTTMEAAQERQRLRQEDANRHLDLALSSMSRLTNIDFLAVRSGCTDTGAGHQWPPVIAGQMDRQDAAGSCRQPSHQGRHRLHRHGRPRRRHDAGDNGGSRR